MTMVALNSVHVLRHFQALASRMTVIDYDLKVICEQVIKHLHDRNNMNELNAYVESFRSRNEPEMDVWDGNIMIEALQGLVDGLLKCFTDMRMYDGSGKLHYRFQALVSQTIMVEATK